MKTTGSTAVELLHRMWPLLKIATVMYATAVATLWASIRALAADSQQFSPLRGVVAAFAMTFVGNSFSDYLGPWIGHWDVLLKLALDILIVKINFPLSFWRAVLVGVIYFGVVTGAYHLYIHLFGPVKIPVHKG